MEEKTNNLTTVAYSKNRAKELTSICKKLGLSKTQFIDASIHQYYRTGEDPREPIKDSLPKKLTAIENRIIGFIKTQDTQYLKEIIKLLQRVDDGQDGTLSLANIGNNLIEDLRSDVIGVEAKAKEIIKEIKKLPTAEKNEEDQNKLIKNQVILNNKLKAIIEITEKQAEDSKKFTAIEKINSLKTSMTNPLKKEDVIRIISEM